MRDLLAALRYGGPLPPEVTLDAYTEAWFFRLWELSFVLSTLSVRETGCALIALSNRVEVLIAHPGSEDSLQLYEPAIQATGFTGYHHTHPYADGTEGIAFSIQDFQVMTFYKFDMLFAHSGKYLFLLVRPDTADGWPDPALLSEPDYWAEYDRHVSEGCSVQEAVYQTNRHFCGLCRFRFYAGRLGELLRYVRCERESNEPD